MVFLQNNIEHKNKLAEAKLPLVRFAHDFLSLCEMDSSILPLDLYPLIIPHLDWATIINFSSVNKFTREICVKEKEKRLNSKYPFGEPNALIKVITDDINLNSIFVTLPSYSSYPCNSNLNKEDERKGKEIQIKNFHSSTYWVKNFLSEWFIYHLPKENWILTSRITKATIRLLNRANQPERLNMNLTGEFQCYIFRVSQDGAYHLEKIM